MLSKEDMLKIVASMEPVKLFIGNDNIFRLRRSLILFGISPANLLLPRYNSSSFDKLQMASGMLPTRLLLNKFNCWSSLHLPKIKWKKYLKYYYYCEHKNYVRSRRVLKKEKKILRENNFLIVGFIVENREKNIIKINYNFMYIKIIIHSKN